MRKKPNLSRIDTRNTKTLAITVSLQSRKPGDWSRRLFVQAFIRCRTCDVPRLLNSAAATPSGPVQNAFHHPQHSIQAKETGAIINECSTS